MPKLADRGIFLASEASFYRVLKASNHLSHRGKSKPRTVAKPKALEAKKPNQLYSWDITYLPTTVHGKYFYLYLFVDIFSRKIVGWKIYECEASELAADLLLEICQAEGLERGQITLHSDNGSPMKAATMIATMYRLGVAPSFSRPSVSDDNPFSESLFKTLKYCPFFPSKPFSSLADATQWMERFAKWYNEEQLHSGIKFVTPSSRHEGRDAEILANRHLVYKAAQQKNPKRWSKETRNWSRIEEVKLNCLKTDGQSDKSCEKLTA